MPLRASAVPIGGEELLTPDQVAQELHLKRKTVMNWLRAGRIPGTKLGKLWRVRRSDLEEVKRVGPAQPDSEPAPGDEGRPAHE